MLIDMLTSMKNINITAMIYLNSFIFLIDLIVNEMCVEQPHPCSYYLSNNWLINDRLLLIYSTCL